MPTMLFGPNHLPIFSNLEDPSSSSHQIHLLASCSLNLSGHTVSLRAVVSLLTVFNLDCHAPIIL